MDTEREIQRLMRLPLTDLYGEFYETTPEGEGFLGSPGMKNRKGRDLFNKYKAQLFDVICDEWQACDKIKVFESDVMKLSSALVAVLTPHFILAAAIPIAVIVIKISVKEFCNCSEKE